MNGWFRLPSLGRAALASLGCTVALASAAAAQDAAQRRQLQAFRDTLELSHDTLTLHELEARDITFARAHRDDPLVHLRLGFIALRIRELGASAHRTDDAESEFEWAVELRPAWPYPWFGLGLAEASAPDRARAFAGGLWTMLGIDRDTRAGTAFLRAIHADPSFSEGVVAFAEIARTQRIGAPLQAALDALRQVQGSPAAWDPQLLLEWGRLERRAGNVDSARVAFQRAITVAPEPAMAQVELARTLPLTGDTLPQSPGAPTPLERAYFAGSGSDDPAVVALYRRDLAPIVDDTVLADFDAHSGAARTAWLRNFWRDRAAADLRGVSSRLGEHFRRWHFVESHFRLPPFRRAYRWGIEIFQSHDDDLDDRGIVWLRQGEPATRIVWSRAMPRAPVTPEAPPVRRSVFDTIVRGSDSTLRPHTWFDPQHVRPGSLLLDPEVGVRPGYGNETWRYTRPDGDMVLNFAAVDDPDDYRLVESILELDVAFDAMAQHEREIPGLAALIGSGPMTRQQLAFEERLRGRRNVKTATTTSAWPRSYSVTMGGRAQWLVAGIRDSLPLVHIVYAVDGAMLRLLPANRRTGLVPITVRAVFLDPAGMPVATLDTVELLPRPPADAPLVASRAELAVPPGNYRMRLDVEANPLVGALHPTDSLLVPDPAGASLQLSSLVLGVRGAALPWIDAPRDTVWFGPQASYAAGDTLQMYLQAYGTRPDVPYTVHVGLVRQRSPLIRLLKGHRESLTMTAHLTLPGGVAELRRAIALNALSPGTYQVEVTVEGAGARVTRRRLLVIRP